MSDALDAVRQPTDAALSPFDQIRRVRPDGTEYWSARDLMPMLGYEKWDRFEDAVDRAKAAAAISGQDVADHFPGAGKKVSIGSGATRIIADYHLSRLACYLVAMNGDPRKPDIAAAQTYFAVRTREAEVAQATRELPRTFAEALRALADESEAREAEQAARLEAETRAAELEPPARAWQSLADARGDYSVDEAAKMLARDPSISIGRDRLFKWMRAHDWVYRSRDGRLHAMQNRVDQKLLAEKTNTPYWSSKENCLVRPAPTIRVTPKGLGRLYRELGGMEPIEGIEVA